MIKHPDYWLEDGTVVIVVEDTAFRLYRSLITRLSPRFFMACCQATELAADVITESDSLLCFSICPEMQISKDDFGALTSHILHDIPLSEEAPFAHTLRLFAVSSAAKGDFPGIHLEAEKQLGAYMRRNPLDIDFSDYALIKNALSVLEERKRDNLKSLLKRALYYSYTTHDDIIFEEVSSPESTPYAMESSSKQNSVPSASHISGADAAICERLMSELSENFSPTLFQPPAALHMQCTDVYATLWMEQAVQPAFADNGTANPFATLQRIRALDWKREADESLGERPQPCDECFDHMRQRWSAAAQAIWELMDTWISG